MGATGMFRLPAGLRAADERLTRGVDQAMAAGYRRAGRHASCRPGCTACCIGPFDITALDAARLADGLAALARGRPRRAAGVRARAEAQWARMLPAFPGDARTGALSDDEGEREDFFARFAAEPCPALHPATGRCELYRARPLSCRTFGLPVVVGRAELPPCPLNFTSASKAEVAACAVAPDAPDGEGELLARLCAAGDGAADTIVAAAVVLATGPRRRSG